MAEPDQKRGTDHADRLENAVLDLERRKIEGDKRKQAEKAMEALEVSKAGAQGEPSKEDVAFVVSLRRTYRFQVYEGMIAV